MDEKDMGLESHWSIMNVVKHTTVMTSLAFDYLAAQNDQITFIHNFPSLVRSDNFNRINPPPGSSLLWRVWLAVVKGVVSFVRLIVGMTPEEAGERQSYHLTSSYYGPGAFRVHQDSEIVPPGKALKHYEDNGWPDRVWEFTVSVWERVLAAAPVNT